MARQRLRREREGFSLKRITAGPAERKKWARLLPPDKDQIFLPSGFPPAVAQGLALEKLIPGRSKRNWGLIERSWFGYLASRAAYRVVLAAGKLEKLPLPQRRALKRLQIKMRNPAIVPSRLLPASLREPERYTWITAGIMDQLGSSKRMASLKAWDLASKITGVYPRISPYSLPPGPKKILRERGLLKLVNTFAASSGPNCFAAAAYAISGRHLGEWMLPSAFFKAAQRAGIYPAKGKPIPGDILVCRQNGKVIHVALYLGGFVFEKPGQDLYEPYRLASWKNWKRDWSHARFECWRERA